MKFFHGEQRSLFGEILDWMLTPLLLLWPVSLALTWLVAQGIADKPFDRALEYKALALSKLAATQLQRLELRRSPAVRELLRVDDSDLVYFQVLGARGELLSGERDFPVFTDEEKAQPGEVRLRDGEMRGDEIRIAYTWVRMAEPSGALALVQVAETREKRATLASEIIKGVMLPQFAILPLAVLLVWLALVRGIKPLSELEEHIRERKPEDLSPLDPSVVPQEVAPLVVSVNDLLRRLQGSIATQKRFLADAAHQLKTPLAGLRMQADLAQRQGASAEELKLSLKQIGRSSVRATHTVNQLLSLARAEGTSNTQKREPVNLARLTMDVVLEAYPRALEKNIDLGYEGAQPENGGVVIAGNATLLQEMVRNLVDNAINYTPENGVVTVRLHADTFGQVLVLQVEDSGPGIPEGERSLVLQPFYRALGTNVDGSGLGLAIVSEIVQYHAAQLGIEDARPGRTPPGVLFSVRFEALPSRSG